jgi:hypothetical protein
MRSLQRTWPFCSMSWHRPSVWEGGEVRAAWGRLFSMPVVMGTNHYIQNYCFLALPCAKMFPLKLFSGACAPTPLLALQGNMTVPSGADNVPQNSNRETDCLEMVGFITSHDQDGAENTISRRMDTLQRPCSGNNGCLSSTSALGQDICWLLTYTPGELAEQHLRTFLLLPHIFMQEWLRSKCLQFMAGLHRCGHSHSSLYACIASGFKL